MVALVTQLAAVSVTAAPVAVDVHTGNQTFQQDDYHGAPTSTTSQIVQQAIAGAARAPTGEVHIRGQHAEYTYYIDGVPVPSSIGGTLNELFDPAIADRIGFQTGGWDAEYGNKNIAVINVDTKIPTDGIHYQLSGLRRLLQQRRAVAAAQRTTPGRSALLVSGTRQETSMRREPLVQDANGNPLNFPQCRAGPVRHSARRNTDRRRAMRSRSSSAPRGRTPEIPYDSSFGVLDDHQTDCERFPQPRLASSVRRCIRRCRVRPVTADRTRALPRRYVRQSTLDYTPGAVDQPQFVFFPDTADRFNVQEHRVATTTGVKADFTLAGLAIGRREDRRRGVARRGARGLQHGRRAWPRRSFREHRRARRRRRRVRAGGVHPHHAVGAPGGRSRLDHHVAPTRG